LDKILTGKLLFHYFFSEAFFSWTNFWLKFKLLRKTNFTHKGEDESCIFIIYLQTILLSVGKLGRVKCNIKLAEYVFRLLSWTFAFYTLYTDVNSEKSENENFLLLSRDFTFFNIRWEFFEVWTNIQIIMLSWKQSYCVIQNFNMIFSSPR
jgi:hypothetical protein